MIKSETAITNTYHVYHKMALRSFYTYKYWTFPNSIDRNSRNCQGQHMDK